MRPVAQGQARRGGLDGSELLLCFGCCCCRERRHLGVFPAWFCLPSLLSSGPSPWAAHACTGWTVSCVSGEVALPWDRRRWSQKVTRGGCVHSQRLLFQLGTFSERLWLEALSGRQAPHHSAEPRRAHAGITRTSRWPDTGLLHPVLSPWGPCHASHPGQLYGSNRMSVGTGGLEVNNLV